MSPCSGRRTPPSRWWRPRAWPGSASASGCDDDDPIDADFTGWSKLVLLTPAHAVLFPRDHTQVEPLWRDVAALRAVEPLGLPCVPVVREVFEDPAISAYPVVVLDRLPGPPARPAGGGRCRVEELGDLFAELGRLAAGWHAVDPALVPSLPRRSTPRLGVAARRRAGARPPTRPPEPRAPSSGPAPSIRCSCTATCTRDSSSSTPTHRIGSPASSTGRPLASTTPSWSSTSASGARRCGGATASDLRELRRRAWDAYAAARGLPDDLGAVFEWHHTCAHARKVLGIDAFPVAHGPDVVGTAEEARDAVRSALRRPAGIVAHARMLRRPCLPSPSTTCSSSPAFPIPTPTAQERRATSVTTAPRGFEGEGFPVRRAFAGVSLADLDPFIHMDEMGEVEWEPGAAKGTSWHPHRGFETVTYMLDGTFQHQDSNGGGGFISDGDTQWMTAGGGILHKEAPPEAVVAVGGTFHGIQLWVNLSPHTLSGVFFDFPDHSVQLSALGCAIQWASTALRHFQSSVTEHSGTLPTSPCRIRADDSRLARNAEPPRQPGRPGQDLRDRALGHTPWLSESDLAAVPDHLRGPRRADTAPGLGPGDQ